MKVLLCLFSGTGNTRRVGERFRDELIAKGVEAEVYSIKKGAPMPATEGLDALVVGYPIHAFNAPRGALAFMKRLPASDGLPVWLLRTSGEPSKLNDAAGITPKRILKKKGYRVSGEFSYVMPYNIMFRHSDGMAARMWKSAELRIPGDAETLIAGMGTLCKVNALRRLVAFTLRIEHSAMPLVGRHFRPTEKCVGCGKCARVCPQNNIKMVDDRPVFGKNCTGCMACAFCCPEDAVKISIFNSWRVNGGYAFDGEPASDDEVCRYCHKMYLRYFHAGEQAKK